MIDSFFVVTTVDLQERRGVLPHPLGERLPRQRSGGKAQDHVLLPIHVTRNFVAVQDEEYFHGSMPNTFVAIQKWVIHDEGEAKRRRLADEIGIEVLPSESCMRLADTGFQGPEIAKASRSTGIQKDSLVKFKNFGNGQVAHQASRR